MSILLDAGPALNFLAVGKQGLLLDVAAQHHLDLATPAQVDREVRDKASGGRFARTGALTTWTRLVVAARIQVLDDSLATQVFIDAVSRVSGLPAADRIRSRKSLGEILVIAHASVIAQQGTAVFVLIDDGDGRARALRERDWLAASGAPGSMTLWSTPQVLRNTAGSGWKPIYERMRAFDDGLPPL